MRAIALILAGAVCASPAIAKITSIQIDKVEPFAEAMSFGAVGAYERVIGKAKGELDPRHAGNRGIVNLDKAPRNARGMVEYETDLFILRPADPAKGNGKLLYEVNNRGRKFLFHWLMDARAQSAGANNDAKSKEDAGNGLFMRQGYTMVWSGWDADAPRGADGMGLAMSVPLPLKDGQPITGAVREELVSGTRGAPADQFRLSYEAKSLDKSQASLTMRRKRDYAPVEIPAGGWEYVNARSIRLLPAGTKPELGAIYDFRYTAKNPKVLGIGYAATRDVVAHLRHDGRGFAQTYAIGISQSGRYLRDHISGGFNKDEQGRQVFDGVLAHISGVGRVFHNYAFGQPGRTNTQFEDHDYPENAFPFSAARLTDPVTGRTGSLLRGDASDPLLMEVNTATEYWQKGASLLHTDPLGKQDVELPRNVRVYMVAGTQHGGRGGLTDAAGPCANPRNPHNPMPALRALMTALDEWVTKGTAPPASRVPNFKDGTLAAEDRIGFPAIPGAVAARQVNAVTVPVDWINPPPDAKRRNYRPLVSKVDADGNEVSGIRLPDIAVPLATYAGWNLYKFPYAEGDLCDRDGSRLAFARTKAEREARRDPRPSLEERYSSHDDYVAKVQAAATALMRERLMLPEDAEAYVARARATNPLVAPRGS
ncbi:MAG: tannase/feruloyl esterase family alpha/beta hydrolase [Alphaproteobacteria bacterium]|nr:tannase/feruloyl esterase family alpha/beta hydrolase [Alphaproteobacteria bacterium]